MGGHSKGGSGSEYNNGGGVTEGHKVAQSQNWGGSQWGGGELGFSKAMCAPAP